MLTIDEIRDLRRAAEGYWKRLHEEQNADYIEVDRGPEVTIESDGRQIPGINPHTAWVKVSTSCNHLIDADLEIRVDSGAESKARREKGEAIAAALRTLHYHLTSDAKSDPHRGNLFDAATMGMGCWYIGVDFSRLLSIDARKPRQEEDESDEDYGDREDVQSWKEERAHCLPLVLDHEDPRHIFPDPATHGDLWVMKIEKRTVGDVRRHWRTWEAKKLNGGKRKSDFDEVEWFELWSAPGGLGIDDPGSYYYEADGIPIKRFGSDNETGEEVDLGSGPWPHGWGICPYLPWGAGYGMPRGDPESVYKGLVRNARLGGLFRAKAEKRTQLHSITRAAAFHGWAVPEGRGDTFEIGDGAVNEMPVDESGRLVVPQPIIGPSPPQVLLSEAAALQGDINAETISDVLSSPGEQGTDVALLYARMVQEAAMALGPLKRNAERVYDRVWACIARLLSNPDLFNETDEFRVVGLDQKGNPISATLSRKLFAGTHVYRTTIDPRFATDQIGRTSNGLAQVKAGVIDRVTHHREYSGLDNPEQIVRKADADAVLRRLIGRGFFDQFAMAWASGQLPKGAKGRDFFAARARAEQEAALPVKPAPEGVPGSPPGVPGEGPSLSPSGRQAPNAAGGAMVRPGGGMVEPGASDALSEQVPANSQRGYQ